MNLPNKLTMVRIILIPVVAILLLMAPEHGWPLWLSAGLSFGAAAITDALDGSIARKRGLITDFGKLMDPVADKLLVTAALVCLVASGLCSAWVLIIVLAREFLITSIRMVAVTKGTVIAANVWGKLKTVIQIAAIVTVIVCQFALSLLGDLELFDLSVGVGAIIGTVAYWLGEGMLWISAAITLISGAVYAIDARHLFKDM